MALTEQPGRPGMAAGYSRHTLFLLYYPPILTIHFRALFVPQNTPEIPAVRFVAAQSMLGDYLAPKSPYKALSLGL